MKKKITLFIAITCIGGCLSMDTHARLLGKDRGKYDYEKTTTEEYSSQPGGIFSPGSQTDREIKANEERVKQLQEKERELQEKERELQEKERDLAHERRKAARQEKRVEQDTRKLRQRRN